MKLKKEIEKYGGTVILIRDGDYDLSSPSAMFRKKSDFDNRIKIINKSNADLYLSIHMNYLSDATYFGPQVFYQKKDEKLATKIQQNLNSISTSDRNVKLMPQDTYMYKRLNIPGLLIECGFLSNANERSKLKSSDYQQKISEAISKGVVMYFTSSSLN